MPLKIDPMQSNVHYNEICFEKSPFNKTNIHKHKEKVFEELVHHPELNSKNKNFNTNKKSEIRSKIGSLPINSKKQVKIGQYSIPPTCTSVPYKSVVIEKHANIDYESNSYLNKFNNSRIDNHLHHSSTVLNTVTRSLSK